MPEFETERIALQEAIGASDNEREAIHRTRQQLELLRRQRGQQVRRLDKARDEDTAVDAQMRSKIAELERRLGEQGRTLAEATKRESLLLHEHLDLWDPRTSIGRLDDSTPILMMPLRLETRFRESADGRWLLVRVFPDDWAVDGFHRNLALQEIESARAFWARYWAAGGQRDGRVTAWRSLVASHGAGRASWIVRNHEPVDATGEPVHTGDNEVSLVIASYNLVGEAERNALAEYWTRVWQSPEVTALEADARAQLGAALGVDADGVAALIGALEPVNLEDALPEGMVRADANLDVAYLQLPDLNLIDVDSSSWTEPALTGLLPERLVLVLRSGRTVRSVLGDLIPPRLALGPNPSADVEEELSKQDGELQYGKEIKWMFDFDEAVTKGLAFRVPLSESEFAAGFDRLMVLGVNLRETASGAKRQLERLFRHHQDSSQGFALLPQGTPTNNSPDSDSGYRFQDDVEGSFDRTFGAPFELQEVDDDKKLDGQWFAELLGINPKTFSRTAHADGRDQCEMRAMNALLWPATVGYTMESLLGEVFDSATRVKTRTLFKDFVIPRGIVPAFRIGDQPYGVLPTTQWSKMEWIAPARRDRLSFAGGVVGDGKFLQQFYEILKKVDAEWRPLMESVPHIHKGGDAHQVLLDTLGLHARSVEFHQRMAHSIEYYQNLINLQGYSEALGTLFEGGFLLAAGWDLLGRLGYEGTELPEALQQIYMREANPISGPLVDDIELDEESPLRALTTDGRNYLEWLLDTARGSLDELRRQPGFGEVGPPRALLYRLIRHALQLGYWDSALRFHESALNPTLNAEALRIARYEAKSFNLGIETHKGLSKYELLYQPAPDLPTGENVALGDYVRNKLFTVAETRDLSEQLGALGHLLETPTARLEQLLVEHLDACTYRLDSWKQALVNLQLNLMRYASGDEKKDGIYLGAFGWLEDLSPRRQPLTPARVDGDLAERFEFAGGVPVVDSANQGYIHAPSLNQAVTSAILRNGYLSNADPDVAAALSVNLSSRRVRQAIAIIEGVRNDQSLGELLGYQFERALHENFELAETDEFIFGLRKAFSLTSNKFESTLHEFEDEESIESIEARNVVDGLALADYVAALTDQSYPFGRDDLVTASNAQRDKINGAVQDLLDTRDAVADLAIAESVHQAAIGNIDGASASMDAYGRAQMPPLPEFVQTPREGIAITHRVVWRFDTTPPAPTPWSAIALTPRALADPLLNQWLASLLPAPETIACSVERTDTGEIFHITVVALALQPLDLLYLTRIGDAEGSLELEQRILEAARVHADAVRPNHGFRLLHSRPAQAPATSTLFELTPLLTSLRRILVQSRPLQPSDLALQHEAQGGAADVGSLERDGLEALRVSVAALAPGVASYATQLQGLLDGLEERIEEVATLEAEEPPDKPAIATAQATLEAHRDGLLADLDGRMEELSVLALDAATHGVFEADFGFGALWRERFVVALDARLDALMQSWSEKLAEFDGYLVQYDALSSAATSAQQFTALQRCERAIATTVTSPLPEDPTVFRTNVVQKRDAFVTKLTEFENARATSSRDLFVYLDAVRTLLPIGSFATTPFGVEAEVDELVNLNAELLRRASAMAAAIEKRVDAIASALAEHDAATEPAAALEAITAGFKAGFGDEFVRIPRFNLIGDQAVELSNAHLDRDKVLRHLRLPENLGRAFPLDEWLYGAARVREKLAELEYVAAAAESFSAELAESAAFDLTSWQLPYAPDDFWVGMEYPDSYEIDSERLLITGYHASDFDPAVPQAGLLIDEWTEVIPEPSVTTGVAFHFDRPNSEPPQAMLLVMPTDFRGAWRWDDLLNAVSETLKMAKQRAIEPQQLDQTAYASLLPATTMATTHHQTTIAFNYAEVNGLQMVLPEDQ